MNTELLLKIKERILAEPRQFQMSSYFSEFLDWEYESTEDPTPIPNCGTAACIAGWALAIHRSKTPAELYDEHLSVEFEVEEALDLSFSFGLNKLFYMSKWPTEFRFEEHHSPEERAKLAAARIDHFIATEGRE